MNPNQFTFTPRSYLHFDPPISMQCAENLATDIQKVATHSFYPFINYDDVTQKITKKKGGGIELKDPKIRPIAYASHGDSAIFAHYGTLIGVEYERELDCRGLLQSVTAFRSLDRKRNIHFANEVFECIRKFKACYAIASDVRDFFKQLDHTVLKQAWAKLFKVDRLPLDHFKVFQAVTRSCQVDRTQLFKVLGIDPRNPRADGRRRLCSPIEFRTHVRAARLCVVNRSGKGIPQGSPISAVLANLYMLEVDTALHALVAEHGGMYRRYCDDLLMVLPTPEARAEVFALLKKLLTDVGLEAHPDKTELIDFTGQSGRMVASRPLNYLGFTFDGQHKRIRPASIARYFKKMRSGVRRARAIRYRHCKKSGVWPPLRRRKLHLLYSYLGRHNFISYALDAARIMNDPGIKKQIKSHWKKLQALIKDGGRSTANPE